jgi:hypothetical protein
MKVCKKCLIEQDESNFAKNKNNEDGLVNYCKECEKIRSLEYRVKNREKINLKNKDRRKENPDKHKEYYRKYVEKNPDKSSKERLKLYRQNPEFVEKEKKRRKKYYQDNIDREREKRKKYYHLNKDEERKKNNNWRKEKMKTDGFFRMKRRLRDRIRDYMKGEYISKKTSDIVGLDYNDFKNYISGMFTEGMCWENYGKWHLDHIKPLCTAKSIEEVYLLNHYTNLQPLWGDDNLKKNRKYGN